MEERLQKYMARCGIASRRKCELLIQKGKVKVNNKVITELGYKINTEIDNVYFESKIIKPEETKVYIMLNKPVGFISTVFDDKGRKTVVDLINIEERIYPIGRLDYYTSGLILLTNDGKICNKVTHPKYKIDKTYIAELKGIPDKNDIKQFQNGINIGGYITSPASIKLLKLYKDRCTVKIIIHEGKNRQIRKMCKKINHPVLKLKRVSIGNIQLGNLKEGSWRFLNKKEIEYLYSL